MGADLETVIYMGGFELPDKNAAAQRVLSNAKAIRDTKKNVVLVGVSNEIKKTSFRNKKLQGFECYEVKYPKSISEWIKYLVDPCVYIKIIEKYKNVKCVIFYNFQSVSMHRIIKYCKKKNIKCVADVTEWYQPSGSFAHRLLKEIDTNYRMKKVHLECDALIVISKYLREYYSSKQKTFEVPPLVDKNESKWKIATSNNKDYMFSYVGKPSDRKERLDLIVESISRIANFDEIKSYKALLCIAGITKEEYEKMYQKTAPTQNVIFWGRVPHVEALSIVGHSNWAIVIRNRTRVVQAGFPTKVVESITCGVPVVANNFSNITDYLNDNNSIVFEELSNIEEIISNALNKAKKSDFDSDLFDYHRYVEKFNSFFNKLK